MTIVVPHGNSTEKNAAMHSLGAELIEHGRDFDEAKEQAVRIATERGLEYAPSFHRDFVVGVATCAHELSPRLAKSKMSMSRLDWALASAA